MSKTARVSSDVNISHMRVCVFQHRECKRRAPRRDWKRINWKGKKTIFIKLGNHRCVCIVQHRELCVLQRRECNWTAPRRVWVSDNQSKGKGNILDESRMSECQHLHRSHCRSHEPKHKDCACTTHNCHNTTQQRARSKHWQQIRLWKQCHSPECIQLVCLATPWLVCQAYWKCLLTLEQMHSLTGVCVCLCYNED